ncbi:MAG TPA: hypothetical protein VFP58_02985 [Candidatus Eisenbacteria bacterium]|nr:hypothetical protein [Candidatus Eisenbacteria bacterium]
MWPFTRFAVPVTLILSFTLLGSPALAGEPRTHDGFFLRLSGGGGEAGSEFDVPGLETEYRGSSGDLNIAVGAVVTGRLALHATFFGWTVSNPTLDIEGVGSDEVEGTLSIPAFGGGLTYYFMPVNLYVTGSLGSASLNFDGGGVQGESGTGVMGELAVGKEWWVGKSWGLGAAAAFGFHSIPDGRIDESWSGSSWSIRFSATLN